MTWSELLETQWKDYGERHRHRTNLLIHIVTGPVFLVGAINVAFALLAMLLFNFEIARLVIGGMAMAVALIAQQQGNALEGRPPEPAGPAADFLRRTAAEQFVTLPRFVLSGGWLRNFRAASNPGASPGPPPG